MNDIKKMIVSVDNFTERESVIIEFFKCFLNENPKEILESGLTIDDFMAGDFTFVTMYIQFETVIKRVVKAKNAIEVKILAVKTVCDVCKSENDVKGIYTNDIDIGQPISHLTLCGRCRDFEK